MRSKCERELAKTLRSENKSFTEIDTIIQTCYYIHKLYTYKRVSHPKKRGKNPFSIKTQITDKKINFNIN